MLNETNDINTVEEVETSNNIEDDASATNAPAGEIKDYLNPDLFKEVKTVSIDELEPDRRSIYCGSIAYIGFDGNIDSNICIRTLIYCNNKIHFFVGGGIVWDSTVESEYKECFDKASAMFKVLEEKSV